MKNNSSVYRTDIDGLRAIAVIAVIINHIDRPIMPFGYLGVDIFFVISGFVIIQSIDRRQYASFREYIFGFYNRRVKRLVPALCFCVVITSALVLLVISPDANLSVISVRTGITSLFGLSNLYLIRQSSDYFGASAEMNVFTHTWSLGVEEQFYFIFPFLLWITGLQKKTKAGYKNTAIALVLLGVASFVYYIWLLRVNPVWAFYLMPTRFWELSIGAVLYLFTLRSNMLADVYPRTAKYLHVVSMILLIVALFLPDTQLSQGAATFTVVILTASLIYSASRDSAAYKFLTLQPVVFLGLISYSLYLWHWSILSISSLTIGVTLTTIPFLLGLILLLSVFSYYKIETPLRRTEWRFIKTTKFSIPPLAYSFLFTSLISLSILLLVLPMHEKEFIFAGVAAPLQKKGVESLLVNDQFNEYSWIAEKCVLTSNDDLGKNITYQDCTFGDFSKAERRFLVIGNSFSSAEIEMYKVIPEKSLGSVTITSAWGAAPVPEISRETSRWNKANEYYWDVIIPDLTTQLQAGDVLMMINDEARYSPQTHNNDSREELSVLSEGLSRISEEMAERGIFIIYQSSNPFVRESQCTPDAAMQQWWNLSGQSPCIYYSKKESLERRKEYHDILLNVQSHHPNFFVLDLFDVFCPGTTCTFTNSEGTFLYRDEFSHPSVEGSRLAQPELVSVIKKIDQTSLKFSPATDSFLMD